MTYNVFGGSLSLTQSINQPLGSLINEARQIASLIAAINGTTTIQYA